tara:strand:+ start:3160 stop:3672 length:513 start_codon:yes stop_codon:yes gene_type:complete
MFDNYCTLEEAWGSDFKRDEKKKKKKTHSKFPNGEQHATLNDTVDSQILISPPHEWSMSSFQEQQAKIAGNKPVISELMSTNEIYPQPTKKEFHYPESNLGDMINITRNEYDNLKDKANKYISGLNSTAPHAIHRTSESEQFNTLLLYIFTGIFLIITHDMMFQLGKKTY